MNLLKDIRHKRTRKRKKHPFERKVFTKISTLVRWYGLDENFLKKLDNIKDYSPGDKMDFIRVRTKNPFDFPLFSLSSRNEYDLTRTLLRKANNPYLSFAHSPKEILLSGVLYRMNAELRPEALKHYDFETLLMVEYAKKVLKDLGNQAAEVDNTPDKGLKTENIENEKLPCETLAEHIKMLHNFIATIESTAS